MKVLLNSSSCDSLLKCQDFCNFGKLNRKFLRRLELSFDETTELAMKKFGPLLCGAFQEDLKDSTALHIRQTGQRQHTTQLTFVLD